MIRSDLCDYNDAYIIVKRVRTVEGTAMTMLTKEIKILPSRIMLHLNHVYQKLITDALLMQKILVFLCQYIIY